MRTTKHVYIYADEKKKYITINYKTIKIVMLYKANVKL